MLPTNRNLIVAALLMVLLTGIGMIAVASTTGSDSTLSRAYLHSYNLDSTGLALEGYCPVTYFTDDAAREGSADFASTYKGVDYHFVSASAKRLFDRSPETFIPAYGGWCAYGMAVEDKFPIDPTNFKIIDGRLMVFLRNVNVDALAKWREGDEESQVVKADAHWKKVSG